MKYIYVCSLMVTISLHGMETKKHIDLKQIQKIKTAEDIITDLKHRDEFKYVKEKRRSMSIDSATIITSMGILALKDLSQDHGKDLGIEKQGALKKQRSNEELENVLAPAMATNTAKLVKTQSKLNEVLALEEITKQTSSLQIHG